MRIISGIARGRKLIPPPTYDTRPTLDRVKEAMFNILGTRPIESIVLDVFAGTGSLGLEAVSRGAKECHLIDFNKESFKALKQNVDNLKFNDKCIIYNEDCYSVLKRLGNKKKKFNMIFIDAPYSKEMIPPAMDIISEKTLLEIGGIIITKIDTKEEVYYGNDKIKLSDKRKYGNTTVCFYKLKEEEDE